MDLHYDQSLIVSEQAQRRQEKEAIKPNLVYRANMATKSCDEFARVSIPQFH